MSMSAVRGPQRFSCARSRPSCSSTACARASRSRGGERGLDRDAQVDERRLVFEAPGRRAVVGRARGQPHLLAVAQQRHGAVENGAAVADIAAEREPAPRSWLRFCRARTSVTPTSLKVAAIGACGLWIVTVIVRTRGKAASTASATWPAAASISRKRCAQNAAARAFDHLVVGDGVHDLVRARGVGEIDLELEIDGEGLADLGLVGITP